MDLGAFRERFRARFSTHPRVFRAPGRVNLIGEHTDYSDGFVFPMAIEMATYIGASPRSDGRLVLHSENYDATVEINIASAMALKHWSDYIVGVAVELRKLGLELGGADMLIASEVPLGAGLSSSAALEVSSAMALLGLADKQARKSEIGVICQRAENNFVGARCGIMDQFISVNGQEGHALMLDCRSLEFRQVPIPAGIAVVACNTMARHSISGGEYNQRRQQCEEAARLLGVRALRDVSMAEFERRAGQLPDPERRRARHVISENARVMEFARALEADDRPYMGRLMAESHRNLRDDFEVSCRELDVMVEAAKQVEGLIGSRMTGGGFGGCTVNLVRDDAVNRFRESVAQKYVHETGVQPQIYVTHAADGAGEVGDGN